MSAYVLLNLLNKLEKEIRCEVVPSILSVFPNEIKKFSNTGAQMQDSIYHYDTKIAFYYQSLHQNVTISSLENMTFLWTSTHNITR